MKKWISIWEEEEQQQHQKNTFSCFIFTLLHNCRQQIVNACILFFLVLEINETNILENLNLNKKKWVQLRAIKWLMPWAISCRSLNRRRTRCPIVVSYAAGWIEAWGWRSPTAAPSRVSFYALTNIPISYWALATNISTRLKVFLKQT